MEAFEKDLNVIISRRIADLYVLPFKNYYRLMAAEQGQLKLFKEVPQDYGCRLITYLGQPRRRDRQLMREDMVGIANGLAWTSVGGELLEIEVAVMPGAGKVEMTVRLGDVMKESIRAAMTFVRANARVLGIEDGRFKEVDIHLHVPEGAVPKDGPSAGITMATAIASALTGIPVRANLAMTGEISLRGSVLAIGGLREKLLAALRSGIETVIIPAENKGDLDEVPQEVKAGLHIVFASNAMEVLRTALTRMPKPQQAPYAAIPPQPGQSHGVQPRGLVMRD